MSEMNIDGGNAFTNFADFPGDVGSGYQDAWNTEGWTAQWGYLPDATPGINNASGSLPEGIVKLELTGEFRDQWGGAWGNLLFSPSVESVVVNGVMVILEPFRIWLRNGQFPTGFAVPNYADDATVTPDTFDWLVTGRIGSQNVSATIPIPQTDESANFLTFMTAVPAGGPGYTVIDGGDGA